MQLENKWINLLLNIIFILLAFACIFPVILVISISFTDQKAIFEYGYQIIPKNFSFDAYTFIFESGMGVGRAYIVTILSTVCGTAFSVLVISLYAYALSRPELKCKALFTFYIFFTMLFSGGLVAWYMVVTRMLKLSNTVWALILPYAMSAWYVIIMRTFFQTSVPISVIESAKLDGAGEFRILIKIVCPLALPAFATIALFQTLTYWNDWFNPMLLITDQKLYNLQFLLKHLILLTFLQYH